LVSELVEFLIHNFNKAPQQPKINETYFVTRGLIFHICCLSHYLLV